jgi:hypothetical protein
MNKKEKISLRIKMDALTPPLRIMSIRNLPVAHALKMKRTL